ncbi:hypothetical protein Q9L58_000354 [Maublancomyces gigas]|uniref:Uncharacterized protein n=1 Tax=Discina gigas TaxID=1032678 RepID=A0ABR3GXS8_9PEZI
MEECTANWDLVCKTYFSLECAFLATVTLERDIIESAKANDEQTGAHYDWSQAEAAVEKRIRDFSHETRKFQKEGFEYLAEIEGWEMKLAILEGKVAFAPARGGC